MENKSRYFMQWHEVLQATKSNVIRAISKIVPPKEVEDIVQETYVRICQMDHPDTLEKPSSFLMKTAKNLALDHIKKAETRLADGALEESDFKTEYGESDQTFKTVASEQEFSHFCEAVRHLPTQCRRAFVLKKVYGYSQMEIAKEMQLSESTVEKHIALGLRKCAEYLIKFQSCEHNDDLPKTRPTSIASMRGN